MVRAGDGGIVEIERKQEIENSAYQEKEDSKRQEGKE